MVNLSIRLVFDATKLLKSKLLLVKVLKCPRKVPMGCFCGSKCYVKIISWQTSLNDFLPLNVNNF